MFGSRDHDWACIDTSAQLGVMLEPVTLASSLPPVEFTR
jgi:hypothetical protein